VYIEFGDLEKAKKLYMEILEKEPENEEVLHNLLEIFYEIKDIKNVEKYSKNILNKNSNLYIKSQFNLAYIKNDYTLAKKILENTALIKNLDENYDKTFFNQIKNIYEYEVSEQLLKILDVLYNYYGDEADFIRYYSFMLIEMKEFKRAEYILMKEVLENNTGKSMGDMLVDLANVYNQNNEQEKFMNIMKILETQSIPISYNMNKYMILKNNSDKYMILKK
ncbi:MAG: hypothetical protein CR959_02075, partial [Fusobacteriales bacterium]